MRKPNPEGTQMVTSPRPRVTVTLKDVAYGRIMRLHHGRS